MKAKKLLVMSCIFLCSCQQQLDSLLGKTKEQNNAPVVIGATISNATANPFFQGVYQSFQKAPTQDTRIHLLLDDAKDDQQTQNAQIDDMIQKGAKVIAVNLVDVKSGSVVIEKAKKNNISVIFYNRNPGLDVINSYNKAYFVDGDATQAGVLQGQEVLNQWKTHPEWDKNKDGVIQYAMLQGIPGNGSSIARTQWAIGTMNSYPVISKPTEKVFMDFAMFKKDIAAELMNKWIADPNFSKVEVILANNDVMALGAIQALESHNINLPVFGIDAIPDAVKMIQDKKMVGTVVNDYNGQVQAVLTIAKNLADGRPAVEGTDYIMLYRVVEVPYKPFKHS